MNHSEKHLEQMLRDLIEDAAKVDLEPKPANLWWTSTYASEEKGDMILVTSIATNSPLKTKSGNKDV